jgi:hypothetical protein
MGRDPADSSGAKLMTHDPAVNPQRSGYSVMELMVWVAGLAAMAGLVEEVMRKTMTERGAGVIGGLLVIYVVYLSLSVWAFWDVPRIIIPTTMLIGGALWTLTLQLLDRVDVSVAFASLVSVPFVTAILLRQIFPRMTDPDDAPESTERSSTVRCLLLRSRGFGPRSTPAKASTVPEL